MYVDHSAITATHVLARASANLVVSSFNEIARWLHRNRLCTDPDKTEFITFSPFCSPDLYGGTITEIALTDPITGRYPVKRSNLIWYLSVFIHHKFDWSHHITIMANRACSTTCALNLLGNSV